MSDPITQQLLGVGTPTLRALRAAVLTRDGDGAETLRSAGYAGGAAMFNTLEARFRDEEDRHASHAPTDEFFRMLRSFFESEGWGRISVSSVHDAAALVEIEKCWESIDTGGGTGCHLTTGALVGFFEQVAEYPVAAMEVECAANGAPKCRFLVGNIPVLDYLYDGVRAGEALEEVAARTAEG
jgi:predicted hydrocarbon binding protein